MIIGPFINGAAIILGALGGALIAHRMPERLRTGMPLAFGVSSMAMGVVLIARVAHMPVMVIATVLGALVGELVRIEDGLALVGGLAKRLVEKVATTPRGISHEAFIESFVAILVLFCASGAGIFGALNEGMTHDPSVLIAKAFLDLPTAAIFATALGLSVATIAIPQMAIQLALAFGATLLMPLTTPAMIADFSATGGVMMLATGLRICGIKTFPIGNMLPGLLFAMPVSVLWSMAF
ncbi:DUF554 domain-containing protein [Pleomorphomonas sp. PLEO]|uniref:DUF554 domain-containing protein n=1 Tax=Pleomorphomonas sp. PLEO TaxID=3239306 RepID=UPI00351E0C65